MNKSGRFPLRRSNHSRIIRFKSVKTRIFKEVKRNSRITQTRGNTLGLRETHAKLAPKDTWLRKLLCECGASYRRNRWHKNKLKEWSYGYVCDNQVNNGFAHKRREMGLDDTGYCDSQMIAEWKMEAMGKLLLESLWTERKSAVQLVCQILRDFAWDEPVKQGSPNKIRHCQYFRTFDACAFKVAVARYKQTVDWEIMPLI